jgi:hypothetical protein
MNRIYLRRVQQGFIPDTAEDWEKAKRYKLGAVVKAEVTNPRNLRFFRKWFALLQVGFQMWEEIGVRAEYKGEPVLPSFERFRKDVTILAGHHHPVVNLKGEIRMEADSIAFGNMSEEEFEKLYNATLSVLVHKVMRGRVSESRLREMAESIEEFAS